MEDKEFIKNFGKISVSKACKKCKANRVNLYSHNSMNKEKAKKVRRYIENEIAKLYIIKDDENG